MAVYHCRVKAFGRSKGQAATAAAAYRTASRIVDERTGQVHDYTQRNGVVHTELFLPANAPEWAATREQLWNQVEKAETRKNSTVAREFEVALPHELNAEQRLALARDFAAQLVQRHGFAADVAIHQPGAGGDVRNHHAHILCTTRQLGPKGFGEKTRELDNQLSGEVLHWRIEWARTANRHLEMAGRPERIDHRSIEAQRKAALERGDLEEAEALSRIPTIHLGPNVAAMERKGIRTERGDIHRDIAGRNAKIIDLAQERKRLEAERAELQRDDAREAIQEEPARTAAKAKVAQVGKAPPPFARGRERHLSELETVRFAEQKPEREAPQEEKHSTPTPPPPARRPWEVKAEWEAVRDKARDAVSDKARRAQAHCASQVERQQERLAAHRQAQPQAPRGLLAPFKRGGYEKALEAWKEERDGLQKRLTQLRDRSQRIGEYAYPYQKGLRLAEQKATQARPELFAEFKQVKELEKAERKRETLERFNEKRERERSRGRGRGR